ncbi:MAG TPA: TetR/AcrR family transcriptional regulator [Propionibacteriaceae bacterium]|nr:TetR/AcrR family transcriptional regulator [Propionibacteriaceae bacterium]
MSVHQPARRPGRPKGGDALATREHALTVAFELISGQGYRGTSMAQIALASGLSQTGLLHHFGSKDTLLAAILERRDAVDAELLGQPASPEPWGQLERFLVLVRANMTRRQIVRLFVTVTAEAIEEAHPAHEWMQRHYASTRALIQTDLERGVKEGWLAPDAPVDHITSGVIAVVDGLQTQWMLDPDFDMAGPVRTHIDMVKAQWGVATA